MTQENNVSFKREVIDFFKDLVVIIAIVLIIRTFIAMPFQISGQSMYSSYYDREFIIVDRLSYRFTNPDRGDVIVFKPHISDDKEYFLKRIVAVPGDTLKIEDGDVFIKPKGVEDFIEINEKYLNEENFGNTFVGTSKSTKQYTLGDDQYFVMGDNRNHSTDSRECFSSCSISGKTNYISKSDITGKLFLDLGFFNFAKLNFTHPEYGIDTTPKLFGSESSFVYENLENIK